MPNALSRAVDAFLSELFGGKKLNGANAVQIAINELGPIESKLAKAKLGEPTAKTHGGIFNPDPKIVIPTGGTKYGNAGDLVFDVPKGHGDKSSEFWKLLEAFDLTIEEVGKIEGKQVPIRYAGGNIVVAWDQLKNDAETAVNDIEQAVSGSGSN